MRFLAHVTHVALLVALTPGSRSAAAQSPLREGGELRAALDSTGYAGTVVVYDLRRDLLVAIGGSTATKQRIPASTFKILNALISLELGVAADGTTVIPWSGERHERSELNRDLDLTTAFRISALPHFQELARRVGEQRMREQVARVGYGNRDISGGQDRFWLDGALRISPLEQIDLLVRLHAGTLPFSPPTMEAVREMMLVEESPEYRLRAKTGWAILPEGNVGWWVGWVERGDEVYFFATCLESVAPRKDFGPARIALTRRILASMGILPRTGD